MKILVINGPNINLLGTREPEIYGKKSYFDLKQEIEKYSKSKNIDVSFFQSNHEGAIIDAIQNNESDAIIINPAGYSHYSVAILDALRAVEIPYVEVHLTDIENREEFRKKSVTGLSAIKIISGKGIQGYLEAIDILKQKNG